MKFLVKERYPIEQFQQVQTGCIDRSQIQATLNEAKIGDNLRKVFTPKFMIYGPSLLEHCFIECGLGENCKVDATRLVDVEKLYASFQMANSIMSSIGQQRGGYIVQKEELNELHKPDVEGQPKKIISFIEFNPMLFATYRNLESKGQRLVRHESFNDAIDMFFSSIESQKLDQRVYQKERDAMKKLDNIKRDHEKRLADLEEQQKVDNRRGYLIETNNDLVEKALFILRSALARQMSWSDIRHMLKEAQEAGDEVALKICSLKFETNRFTMLLDDPYEQPAADAADSNTELNEKSAPTAKPAGKSAKNAAKSAKQPLKSNQLKVDISLELSAYGNARRYFEERKTAKKKEDKTIEASGKALKSAQIKTAQALKEVQVKSSIIKSRKVLWFEKFYFFISSENYIVIAGRDAQQNEMIVKRYLRPGDLYVHADLHGASSVVIKNMSGKSRIPAKTIEEAGCFAVCYSSAWTTKVPVRAWWVNAEQVSKTAPSGEVGTQLFITNLLAGLISDLITLSLTPLVLNNWFVHDQRQKELPARNTDGHGFLFLFQAGRGKHHESSERSQSEVGRERSAAGRRGGARPGRERRRRAGVSGHQDTNEQVRQARTGPDFGSDEATI